MAGEEHHIETLTGTSTFFDFYMEVRKVLGLPLWATTSVALVFQSAAPNRNIRHGGGWEFRPNEIVPPSRVLSAKHLRGCRFQAVHHS